MITLTARHDAYGSDKKAYVARITGRDSKFTFQREFISRGGRDRTDATADVDDPGVYELRAVDKKGRVSDGYVLIVETPDGLRKFPCGKEDAMKVAREVEKGRPFSELVAFVPAAGPSPLGAAVAARADHAARYANGEGKDQAGRIRLSDAKVVHLAGPDGYCERGRVREYRAAEIARLDAEIERRRAAGEQEVHAAAARWEFATARQAQQRAAAQSLEEAVAACLAALRQLDEAARKKVMAELRKRLAPQTTPDDATPAS